MQTNSMKPQTHAYERGKCVTNKVSDSSKYLDEGKANSDTSNNIDVALHPVNKSFDATLSKLKSFVCFLRLCTYFKEHLSCEYLCFEFTFVAMFITARKRSLPRLCFYMCLSFCPQGGLPQCMLGCPPDQAPPSRPPLDQAPPWDQAPLLQEQTPPAQCMLGDTVNKRAVCILLECNLVNFHAFADPQGLLIMW